MKITQLLIALLAVAVVACEPVEDKITPPDNNTEEPNENEGNENEGNENEGNEDNSWIENPTPMPEATYALNTRLSVSSLVTITDGMRNDYMTFLDELTGYAVYLDIYTDQSNTTLPTRKYMVSSEQMNTIFYQWSYFTPYTDSDLYRFSEGWAEVIADTEHSSGYPYHKIRAYFVMESGESVSIDWEGTIALK